MRKSSLGHASQTRASHKESFCLLFNTNNKYLKLEFR
jgi:hypothetical protein